MRAPVWAILPLACVGCEVPNEGDLGRFELEATRTESCGDTGLLASAPAMTDTVLLRKGSQESLKWQDKNGLMIMEIGEHGNDFSGYRTLVVDMRAGNGDASLPPCAIQRVDVVEGLLEGDEQGGYTGFEANLRFDFAPIDGSSCDDLHTPDAIASGVPCSIAYDATGSRLD